MRNIYIVFALLLPVLAFSQQPEIGTCPSINVAGPSGVTLPGNSMPFTAIIKPYDPEKMTLVWSLTGSGESDLRIAKGQGSSSILVTSDRLYGRNITATLTIRGLPEGCSNSASETAGIDHGDPVVSDEYGQLKPNDEKARLTYTTIQLKSHPGSTAYYVLSYPSYVTRKAIEAKERYIKQQLAKLGRISPDRVRFVYNARDFYKTEIYIVPSGVEWWGEKTTLDDFRPQLLRKKRF